MQAEEPAHLLEMKRFQHFQRLAQLRRARLSGKLRPVDEGLDRTSL